MGSPCMESMQNKTLPLSPLHLFFPTKLTLPNWTSKEEGILTFGVMIDTPEVWGGSVGLWPSSPVCSLCPSSPACLLQRSFTHLCKKNTRHACPKRKNNVHGWLLASDRKGVSKVAINQDQAVWHSKYHGVTSTRQHQAGHYSVKHLCQASLTSSFQS